MKETVEFLSAAYEWVYRWQTLVGAILALIVAVVTIFVMHGQRRDETDRHREAQRRKKLAARAQMPDALSELSAYVVAYAVRVWMMAGAANPGSDHQSEACSQAPVSVQRYRSTMPWWLLPSMMDRRIPPSGIYVQPHIQPHIERALG